MSNIVAVLALLASCASGAKGGSDGSDGNDTFDSAADSDSTHETGDDTGSSSGGDIIPVDKVAFGSWVGDVESLAGFTLDFARGEKGAPELLVSAPTTVNFESPGPLNGAVYVVAPTAQSGSDLDADPLAKVQTCEPSTLDGFGWSIDARADLNLDGFYDLLVGAPYAGYSQSGFAFVIGGPIVGNVCSGDADATWTGNSFEAVGSSLAAVDLDVDGEIDLGIGVPLMGRIEVLRGSSSGVLDSSDVTLEFVGESVDGGLGLSFDNVGDLDGDGIDDIALGAPLERSTDGSVYVFDGPIGIPIALATDADTVIRGAETAAKFGNLVRRTGDLDQDGVNDFVAGAYLSEGSTGELFIVAGSDDLPSSSSDIGTSIRGEAPYDMLGISAMATDTDGDSIPDLAVAAPAISASSPGKLYVFEGPVSDPLDAATDAAFVLRGEASGDLFGLDFASSDVDGDGSWDLAVGAPFNDHGSPSAGSAYLILEADLQ